MFGFQEETTDPPHGSAKLPRTTISEGEREKRKVLFWDEYLQKKNAKTRLKEQFMHKKPKITRKV